MSNLLTIEETKVAREVLKEFFLGLKEFLTECIENKEANEELTFSMYFGRSIPEYFCFFRTHKSTNFAKIKVPESILNLMTEQQLINYGIGFITKHE
mgnify:CR=1 FL=1